MNSIYSSIYSLESLGKEFKTISFPVIAGKRLKEIDNNIEKSYKEASKIFIDNSIKFLEKSKFTKKINLFIYNQDEQKYWIKGFHENLGKATVGKTNEDVLLAMKNQLIDELKRVKSLRKNDFSSNIHCIDTLISTLKNNEVNLHLYMDQARKFLELMINDLIEFYKLKSEGSLLRK